MLGTSLAVLAIVVIAYVYRKYIHIGSLGQYFVNKTQPTMIFVGGLHLTGTSVVERLLSSQEFASGLAIDSKRVADRKSCISIDKQDEGKCLAPENEGIFVTREFSKYYIQENRVCVPNHALHWGLCATKQHLVESDCTRVDGGKSHFRHRLMHDWSIWWDMSKPYLIEKDIPNTVKTRFLQELFDDRETAFVVTLRHPMAICKGFKCDVEKTLHAWLAAYKMLEKDLEHVNHYLILHMEHLTTNPRTFTKLIRDFLGWKRLDFIDDTDKPPYFDRKGLKHILDSKCIDSQRFVDMSDEEIRNATTNCFEIGRSIHAKPNVLPKVHPKCLDIAKNTSSVWGQNLTALSREFGCKPFGSMGTLSRMTVLHPERTKEQSKPLFPRKSLTPTKLTNLTQNRATRRLNFHAEKDFRKHNQTYLVKVSRTESTELWSRIYASEVRKQPDIWRLLLSVQKELNRFGYAIDTLRPINANPVWKRSSEGLNKQDN